MNTHEDVIRWFAGGGAGCPDRLREGTSGGPGVTNPPRRNPLYGQADNTFNLSVPRLSTSLKQGETKEVSIGIKRGKNFQEDVTLKFADGPQGVTLDPASPVIKHGDTEAKVTLKAAADASLGDFTVKVTGTRRRVPTPRRVQNHRGQEVATMNSSFSPCA